jgi:hypothetical protein
MTDQIRREAQIAAKWWADCFRNGPKFDNGDKSKTGFMTMALAKMAYRAPTPDAIDAFEKALARAIEVAMIRQETAGLHVDYGPNLILYEAAQVAQFPREIEFPWKTHMHVKAGSVKVSYGYGAPYEELIKDD